MLRMFAVLGLSLALAVPFTSFDAGHALAAGKAKAASTPAVKAGKGEKVCRYKFPTGEKRAWICKKEEPCCAWDAITYVKCGSTITGCL